MKRALRVTLWWALALSIVTFLLWPLLTLAAGTVWSEGYFTFWIVLSIVWGLVAGAQPASASSSSFSRLASRVWIETFPMVTPVTSLYVARHPT